jgi:hypothetical protein
MVAFCLLRAFPRLCVGAQSCECSRSQSSGAYSQDAPSGNSILHHLVFLLIVHRFFLILGEYDCISAMYAGTSQSKYNLTMLAS